VAKSASYCSSGQSRVHMACVLSMLLCSCETWAMYQHHEKTFNAFIFRCLRSILVSWRYRAPNITIFERTGVADTILLHRMNKYGLRWSGHVCRMEDCHLPKDTCGQASSAPRPVVRHELRYKDVLKRNLKELHINTKNWEQLAVERVSSCSLL